jgi:hypothetical protein
VLLIFDSVEVGHDLKLSDQRLEYFRFLLYSCGGFSVTLIRCSVKCARGLELLTDSIFTVIVSHVILLVLIVFFCCDFRLSNSALIVNSFSIAIWF